MASSSASAINRFLKAAGRAGPAALAVLLPKCPLCVAGYAAALSACGIGVPVYEALVLPLTVAMCLASTTLLVLFAPPRLRIGALLVSLSLLGSAVAAKLVFDSTSAMIAADVCFVAAAIAFNARSAKRGCASS